MVARTVNRGPVVNVNDVAAYAVRHGDRYAASVRRIGSELRAPGLGCSAVRLPAGKCACPFHVHHGVDELFYILEGNGRLRWGNETFAIRAGDCISCPAATSAHQIVNDSEADLVYLCVSTISRTDVADYPDSGKVAFDVGDGVLEPPRMSYFRGGVACDYWDGEP
jgi:uncharacterized cupin superfamily protein